MMSTVNPHLARITDQQDVLSIETPNSLRKMHTQIDSKPGAKPMNIKQRLEDVPEDAVNEDPMTPFTQVASKQAAFNRSRT